MHSPKSLRWPGGAMTSTLVASPATGVPDVSRGSAVRRIDEAIESLTPTAPTGGSPGTSGTPGTPGAPSAPMAFRWRGRRYIVDSVLAHWVETGAWWRQGDRLDRLERFGSDAVEPSPPADPERWVWRVEVASAGRRSGDHRGVQTGVFDLCLEPDSNPSQQWSLHAIYD